ncbi:UNVERIFIED_CONTAM: Inositol phosphorylceramide glucuronosyltransferase 1 [Sesamum radiatum]|uniref:Inositol phosphorylceramide glucuronosyltransferase 1 n=1 Tax=Sesamum radiatum TaxID=300843 RepID=A0AAW2KB43_SESRA
MKKPIKWCSVVFVIDALVASLGGGSGLCNQAQSIRNEETKRLVVVREPRPDGDKSTAGGSKRRGESPTSLVGESPNWLRGNVRLIKESTTVCAAAGDSTWRRRNCRKKVIAIWGEGGERVCRFDGALGSQNSEEAYVTLLYGDEFLLGVRVLGKSIRDTGSTKDMVALVSDGVSNYAKKLLQLFSGCVKIGACWITDFVSVVYLDADTIVVKNIEDLFKCQKFCANLKHSERLNSGVMVVEPSEEVFKDMMTKVNTMYSYTGGDQGFLNSYFPDFANARIFDPYASAEELKSRPIPQMERLSTLYNADVGLYMLANKWMVDEAELRVIHYTLGPLKPWDWWTHWLVKPVDVWQNARIKLDETLPGTGGGQNPKDKLQITFLVLLPLVFLVFCYYRSYLQTRSLFDHIRHIYYKLRSGGVLGYSSITSSTISSNQQLPNAANKVPVFLGAMSVVVCIMAALFSLALSFSIVPRQVMPWTGLLLVYEWTFTLFFLLFGSYLHVVHHWGKHVANQTASFSSRPESLDNDSRKGHVREMSSCDAAACYYGLGMASLALVVPLLPCLLGVTALFLRYSVISLRLPMFHYFKISLHFTLINTVSIELLETELGKLYVE